MFCQYCGDVLVNLELHIRISCKAVSTLSKSFTLPRSLETIGSEKLKHTVYQYIVNMHLGAGGFKRAVSPMNIV